MSIKVNRSRCLLLCFVTLILGIYAELQSKLKEDLFDSLNERLGKLSIIACYVCFEVEALWNKNNWENFAVVETNLMVNCYLESSDSCLSKLQPALRLRLVALSLDPSCVMRK